MFGEEEEEDYDDAKKPGNFARFRRGVATRYGNLTGKKKLWGRYTDRKSIDKGPSTSNSRSTWFSSGGKMRTRRLRKRGRKTNRRRR